jgi:hypothetical protein
VGSPAAEHPDPVCPLAALENPGAIDNSLEDQAGSLDHIPIGHYEINDRIELARAIAAGVRSLGAEVPFTFK